MLLREHNDVDGEGARVECTHLGDVNGLNALLVGQKCGSSQHLAHVDVDLLLGGEVSDVERVLHELGQLRGRPQDLQIRVSVHTRLKGVEESVLENVEQVLFGVVPVDRILVRADHVNLV